MLTWLFSVKILYIILSRCYFCILSLFKDDHLFNLTEYYADSWIMCFRICRIKHLMPVSDSDTYLHSFSLENWTSSTGWFIDQVWYHTTTKHYNFPLYAWRYVWAKKQWDMHAVALKPADNDMYVIRIGWTSRNVWSFQRALRHEWSRNRQNAKNHIYAQIETQVM